MNARMAVEDIAGLRPGVGFVIQREQRYGAHESTATASFVPARTLAPFRASADSRALSRLSWSKTSPVAVDPKNHQPPGAPSSIVDRPWPQGPSIIRRPTRRGMFVPEKKS
jgi:hypothetical protein